MGTQVQEEGIQATSVRQSMEYITGKTLTSSSVKLRKSKINDCVFYQGKRMYTIYTDDYILEGIDKEEIRKIVAVIKELVLNTTREGDIEDLRGFNIDKVNS